MSSATHESIKRLFANRPSLVAELLRDVCGLALSEPDRFVEADSSLSDLPFVDYRPDLVLVAERGGAPLAVFVLEGQLRIDDRKLRSWPLYLTAKAAIHRCPCFLVVVTPDAEVARWAARPIVLPQPRSQITPIVLGPDAIPPIVDPDVARRNPELAVLSATMHGHGEHAVAVARAALLGATGLDASTVSLYDDLVWAALSESARRMLEDLMNLGRYEYQSEHVRRHIEQGRAEGRAEGKVEALLKFLASRGLQPTLDQAVCIRSCADLDRLDAWLDRALAVASIDELLSH
jgi:hypothetical protein